jgi:hypothetical protein
MELTKGHRQGDEVLARRVVQVSGDFSAFFVLQLQKPARKVTKSLLTLPQLFLLVFISLHVAQQPLNFAVTLVGLEELVWGNVVRVVAHTVAIDNSRMRAKNTQDYFRWKEVAIVLANDRSIVVAHKMIEHDLKLDEGFGPKGEA